jgi:hypothetical protein
MPITSSDEQEKATSFHFSKLESLRLLCRQIQRDQVLSLNYFRSGVGFIHVRKEKEKKEGDISVSSSATCVLSLVATGEWKASKRDTTSLAKQLLAEDQSAGLEVDNPFTLAWILDAVTVLEHDVPEPFVGDDEDKAKIDHKEKKLQAAVELGKGSVSIATYPGSPYLTQLVVRVLRRRRKLLPELETMVNDWAWGELTRQLALVQAKSKMRDAFAFAYLLMLVTSGTPTSELSPERNSIQRASLRTVFDCQLKDGTWPLSRPLFHYPKVGNAHCYEFEMLTQLLQEQKLEDLLLDYLPNLYLAAESLLDSVYRLDTGVSAWASGHHPQLKGPESWTTASVFHFVQRLDRLLSEAVRREVFSYLDQLPGAVAHGSKEKKDFAPSPGFLDSNLDLPGKPGHSLRDFLWEDFVKPLSNQASEIVNGRKFDKRTPISAIFFGPPGTSKTELSKKVAEFLGWPLLSIDPSHLLRNGMDGIQAEANAIFRRLEETERVVVLFDEFDELVRERGFSDADAFSRFLTTAMLPKLASIHKNRTLVFIIATNNIGDFDLAIRRQGRFDHVVQVMPPTFPSKMEKKDWGNSKIDIGAKLRALKVAISAEVEQRIGDLTYGECDELATEVAQATTAKKAREILKGHWDKCTLKERVSKAHLSKKGQTTWAERCEKEAKLSR